MGNTTNKEEEHYIDVNRNKNICYRDNNCKNMDNTGKISCPYAKCKKNKCSCGKGCKHMKDEETCCKSIVFDELNKTDVCCRGNATDNDLCPVWKKGDNARKPPKHFCGFNSDPPVFENGRWKCKNYFSNVEAFSNETIYSKF